jgi:hypothetical protein
VHWRREGGRSVDRDRWIGTEAYSKAVAIFFRHPRRDRRVIFDDMSIAIDDFLFLSRHNLSPD